MRRAVNMRLDENIVLTLEQLSKEFQTTKTDVVERAIKFFSQKNMASHNTLLEFAGVLDTKDAESMIDNLQSDKNSKEFSLEI
jgi:predicted transcriptional regulator